MSELLLNEGKMIGNGTNPDDIPQCSSPDGHSWKNMPPHYYGQNPKLCVHCGLESDYDSSD